MERAHGPSGPQVHPEDAWIRVRGARVHNLRDLDVDLPRDRLVVLTGVSGSGKSSLAFDTIHAEGRRRYLESLSAYARAFLDPIERPDVDRIDGLPPTVAIDQLPGPPSPRSTVATLTEIHDYLRLLYARTGLPHCPRCGQPIRRQAPEQIVNQVLALPEGRKVILLAPMVRGRKGQHAEVIDAIRRAGLLRARIDGQIVEIEPVPRLARTKPHDIEAVVDRLVVREGIRPRLAESVDRALKLSEGTVLLSLLEEGGPERDLVLSTRYGCPDCGVGLAELEPRTFSFNSPHGACPSCDGLGCGDCGGSRLRAEARAVTIAGQPIHELCALRVAEALPWLDRLGFEAPNDAVGPPIVREIRLRLQGLDRVGLDYLTLDRPADTLSGGELQRVRLASRIGSGLVGAAFVLDEPTAGLHPRDTDRLLGCLRDLRDAGNSVLVVEHDEAVIRAADWVIDLGPGPGPLGGRVVAQGRPEALSGPESLTAAWLRDSETPAERAATTPGFDPAAARWITVVGPREHNLKGEPARFPVGALSCVTGVSGSGKSSLVLDVLAQGARRALEPDAEVRPGAFDRIDGLDGIDRVILVDQAPIGRTPRSTPATYTGVFDAIRQVFARTREAQVRGFKASRFSFNARSGRCSTCKGHGVRRIALRFLPDLVVRCESCDGQRFDRPTLAVRYKGRSIADVLALRVDEAVTFFEAVPDVLRGLAALQEAGLGYITLGQSSTTLSGGEAQRVKLAAELARPVPGRALYVLDEPTTGLHHVDIARLLGIFGRLTALGHTVVLVEHNLDVIRAADWIVDLGPEGGPAGGHVVAMGPPEAIAACPASFTGSYLGGTTPPVKPARRGRPRGPTASRRGPGESSRGTARE